MQEDTMVDDPRVHEVGEGTHSAGISPAWMRRHLSDSIYLWACGEKADDEDDDIKLSDRLIGWLVLFMQGFAYTMLIVLARSTSNSGSGSPAEDSEESDYLLPSVTGAMYLLVASTTHDLRAGFTLFMDGTWAGHRAFGFGLLIVYGIMTSAAITVLVSTSDDSASVVLNAVTVLFIAELDEKALKFLVSVPEKWRLFWAIESIGISFALALLAIFYIGDDSPLLVGNSAILQTWPVWLIWFLNPTAMTVCSYVLSSTLQAVCDFCSEACVGVEERTVGVMVTRILVTLVAAIKRAKERVRGEPCFYATLSMWLTQGVVSWFFSMEDRGFPVAFYFAPASSETDDSSSIVITDDKLVLLYSNVLLATGLAAKTSGVFQRRQEVDTAVSDFRCSSGVGVRREGWGSCAGSRVPSLLVGWGIGYWVTSLIYVLICSWHGGGCGWNNAPSFVTLIAYVIVPCFLVASILMVADTNFLGTRFGAFVKPAVEKLKNRRRAEYWIMASVFRDLFVYWVGFCKFLRLDLD